MKCPKCGGDVPEMTFYRPAGTSHPIGMGLEVKVAGVCENCINAKEPPMVDTKAIRETIGDYHIRTFGETVTTVRDMCDEIDALRESNRVLTNKVLSGDAEIAKLTEEVKRLREKAGLVPCSKCGATEFNIAQVVVKTYNHNHVFDNICAECTGRALSELRGKK